MRVIWPSAKMQTTSPFWIASLAVCSDLSMSRGRSSGGNRNGPQSARQRFHPARFVNCLEHHEAHGPVGRSDGAAARPRTKHDCRRTARRPWAGMLSRPMHPHAIERVRGDPQDEAQEASRAATRRRKPSPPRVSSRGQENTCRATQAASSPASRKNTPAARKMPTNESRLLAAMHRALSPCGRAGVESGRRWAR